MTNQVFAYPDDDRYERWKELADGSGESMSEFVQNRVEAGVKKFDARVEPDESVAELREQRNRLRADLERARGRIETLENRLDTGFRSKILDAVKENPGIEHGELKQTMAEDVDELVTRNIEFMDGESLTIDDGEFYYLD